VMAFYTTYQEDGAKRFHPTPELEQVLRQERIKEADLKAFRSSNKVEALLGKVLQKRGFSHDYSAREWVRIDAKPKPKSLSVFDWAQENLAAKKQLDLLLGIISHKIRPIREEEISFLKNVMDGAHVINRLKHEGWIYCVDTMDWRPPKGKSVIDRVYEAMWAYQIQFGVLPNKLWISNQEWHVLIYENPYSGGAHFGGPRMFQGMKVELMAPGTKLFVGTAADYTAADTESMIKAGQAVVFKDGKIVPADHGEEPIGIAQEVFGQEGKVTGKVYFGANQAGKTTALESLLKKAGATRSAQTQPPAPATKKIIPPSQLKRKLAL
jgi:hypothetical protein